MGPDTGDPGPPRIPLPASPWASVSPEWPAHSSWSEASLARSRGSRPVPWSSFTVTWSWRSRDVIAENCREPAGSLRPSAAPQADLASLPGTPCPEASKLLPWVAPPGPCLSLWAGCWVRGPRIYYPGIREVCTLLLSPVALGGHRQGCSKCLSHLLS